MSKLLLHACCGPCSLEPVRLLREQGFEPVILYANSNIQPAEEYERRLATLKRWTSAEGIELLVGPYEPSKWAKLVARPFEEQGDRSLRCRACYRMRLREAASAARERGFDAIATTLSVSPYQDSAAIEEELAAAADAAGLEAVFEDYRPYYPEATRRSRALDMYRQNYCGCALSRREAEEERAVRRAERQAEKERKLIAEAPKRAAEEALRQERRAERQAYEAKQRAKKAARKAWRQSQRP